MLLLFANYITMGLSLLAMLGLQPFMEDQWVLKSLSSICPSKISTKGLLGLLCKTNSHSPASMGPIKFHSGSFPFFDTQAR
jgi:hypothetical protein